MDNKKVIKRLIDYHKTSLENCFSMMVALQQQAENILNFFHYLPIMTDEGKKFMKQRTSLYKSWIDDLKKAMDAGYEAIEKFYDNQAVADFNDQTRKMVEAYMDSSKLMPQEVMNLLNQLDHLYKNGCDEFKKYVEENRRQVENYYKNLNKSSSKNKP